MKNLALFAAIVLAGTSSAVQAAVTIDFNSGNFFRNDGTTAAVDDGFSVALSPASGNSFITVTSQANLSNNGTNALFLANNGSLTLTETSPTLAGFDLLSLDIRGSFESSPGRWASLVTFSGTKVGGGTVTFDFGNLTNMFQTVALPGTFTGLSSVAFNPTINANNGVNNFEFVTDNIVVQAAAAVPEPASWAMMLAGFGLAGAAMRRRAKVAVTFA